MKHIGYCAFTVVLTIACVAADVPHDLSSLDQPIGLDTASPTGELKSLSKEELPALVTKQNAAIAAYEEQKAVRTKQIALGEQEKFGFGGMMTSGTLMQMSSGFEEKKLGEVVGLSDPGVYVKSTLAEEENLSDTTGFGPSACSNPFEECTPALCEGHIEGFSGGLNCPSFVSSECPDDLSKLGFFTLTASGTVHCKHFGNDFAISKIVRCFDYDTGKVCTKPGILHPHLSETTVVAIILKRMMCSGSPEKCFSYKVAHCIDSSKNTGSRRRRAYFRNKDAQKATDEEYRNAYNKLKYHWDDIYDTETGRIKDAWACDGDDAKKFRDTVMNF